MKTNITLFNQSARKRLAFWLKLMKKDRVYNSKNFINWGLWGFRRGYECAVSDMENSIIKSRY